MVLGGLSHAMQTQGHGDVLDQAGAGGRRRRRPVRLARLGGRGRARRRPGGDMQSGLSTLINMFAPGVAVPPGHAQALNEHPAEIARAPAFIALSRPPPYLGPPPAGAGGGICMARDVTDAEPVNGRRDLVAWFEAGCKAPENFRVGSEHEKIPFYRRRSLACPLRGRARHRRAAGGDARPSRLGRHRGRRPADRPVRPQRRRRDLAGAGRPVRAFRRAGRRHSRARRRARRASRSRATPPPRRSASAFSRSA